MSPRKKLPIGIQTFAKLRDEGCYYVDKTPLIAQLVSAGSYYFLSRPRRFGKSLLLDTIAEAFAANRALFDGLYLAEHWDWGTRYPVIRISFAIGPLRDVAQLERSIAHQLADNAERLGLGPTARVADVTLAFDQLIRQAAQAHGQRVVVLVDEYDKPILDKLEQPEVARAMREVLKNLYSVLKGRDEHLKFVFLTGVSKFSKVSIFSGLNNLSDITLDQRYATLCGYTDADVDTVFAPELPGLDRDDIRRWYNGYQWGEVGVYNPFDLLLLFDQREFRPWWFETGTPTFLIQWLRAHQFFTPQLERMVANEDLLSTFDVDRIRPEAMLWQTGYLTVQARHRTAGGLAYTLGLPNLEVRAALNRALMGAWVPDRPNGFEQTLALYDVLGGGDAQALRGYFERLFAAIPADWYRNNPIAHYEGYFASVFYSHLASLGLAMVAEDNANQGRVDLSLRTEGCVWLFEFKLTDADAPTGAALAQLKARDYAAKYRAPGVRLIEVGIEFSPTRRQIVGWQTD